MTAAKSAAAGASARPRRARTVGHWPNATLFTRQTCDTRAGMPHGDGLRDAAAHAVTDDARFFDIELVEHGDDAVGLRLHVHRALHRAIASPEAEQIEHDEAMARRHERDDIRPEMARGREPVYEHDRVAGAARAGGVVVDPCAVEIEELTAHASARFAWGREDDRFGAGVASKAKRAVTLVTARSVFRELRWIARAT